VFIPILFIVISLVLLYLAHRLLKSGLKVIKYFFVAILVGFAILFIIAAIKYVTPVARHFP